MYTLYIWYLMCVFFFFLEATEKIVHDLHTMVLKCVLWWTCHSEVVGSGLSRTTLISGLCNLLPVYIKLNLHKKVRDICF